MGKSDLIIRIPSGSSEAHVTLTNERGIASHKTVVMDNLISTLTSSFRFSTGLLPNNTRFFSGTTTDYVIGIESPPRVRRFLQASYSTRGKLPKELKIPFPTCLFVFRVNGQKVRDSRAYSLRGSASREIDTVCRFPFGNTYNDGRICWGGNKLPAINNPVALVSVVATFYDAPFNGDLYDSQTIRRPLDDDKVNDFWSMLVYLNGKEIFPQEMLRDLKIQLSRLMRDPNV
jgi:hypothetical protein